MFSVCVRLFCICVVLYLGRGLRRADHSSKESYRLCIDPKKNENLDTVRVRYKSNGYKKIIFAKITIFLGVTSRNLVEI
jgi:hypothetical protein